MLFLFELIQQVTAEIDHAVIFLITGPRFGSATAATATASASMLGWITAEPDVIRYPPRF
jgi:hypothetical protein